MPPPSSADERESGTAICLPGIQPAQRTHIHFAGAPQRDQAGNFLEVRAARDPRALVPALRGIAHTLDPEVRVYDVRTMDQLIGLATWRARLAAVLLGLMAALSLTIAAVGIYGVFSYAVVARSREIGVRIALGAGRERILGMVLREGAALSAAALAVGLPAAWMLTRTLSSQLYRVSPADPVTRSEEHTS